MPASLSSYQFKPTDRTASSPVQESRESRAPPCRCGGPHHQRPRIETRTDSFLPHTLLSLPVRHPPPPTAERPPRAARPNPPMSTPAGVAPRRSSRLASSAPPLGAGQPSSSPLPRRRRRRASPSGCAREVDNSPPPVVILDDNEMEQHVEAEEMKKQGEESVEANEAEEKDKDAEVLEELPDWLPDGWIMEVRCGDNGNIYRYYTSPVSGYTFSTKMETLHYLFSEMDERVLESQACADDNELHRMHTWLPDGWAIEVRAGGKKMEKMYKFYVHLPTGMRFLSKENVLLYSNEGKISRCDVKGLCDTSSEDNILAMVEFNPDGLPEGWVKEIIFRKCNDGIRKDPYYTDPVSRHVFRTLKSVINYLETGQITKHAYIPRRSPQSMLKRLKIQGKAKKKSVGASVKGKKLSNGLASNNCMSSGLDPEIGPEERKLGTVKSITKEAVNSDTIKRSRGRPPKILMPTIESTKPEIALVTSEAIKRSRAEGVNSCLIHLSEPNEKMVKATSAVEPASSNNAKRHGGSPQKKFKHITDITLDCAKSSNKESEHIVTAKKLGIGGGEQVANENTLEHTNMKEHLGVIQDYTSNRKKDKLNLITDPDLHEHKNGKFTEKLACTAVHKFYMRRSSNHTVALKKG
uniref:MBD domain-containing protein n=1 Tax=Oryza rufipogon TaxID=4529 RepID=A0A0E0P6I2_ORYRU